MKLCSLHSRRGFTLIEVSIAIALAAIVSLGLYGSAIFTMRNTAKNIEQITAVQLVSSGAAKVRAARYSKVTADPSTVGSTEFEKYFTTPQLVQTDTKQPQATSYTLSFAFAGFGKGITQVTGNQYKLTLPVPSGDWKANEFKGRFLVITGGTGVNQARYIVSNDASVGSGSAKTVNVTLSFNFDGTGDVNWGVAPDASSVFCLDYGLYCTVKGTWGIADDFHTIEENVYLSNAL